MKPCKKCCKKKPLKDFPKQTYKKSGNTYFAGKCRSCTNEDQREHNQTPEVRDRRYRRLYNICIEDYYEILASQESKCAICATDTPDTKTGWHVDHDHQSGKVRGILCHKCNAGLGYFKDEPAVIHAAARYLVRRKI